MTCAPTRDLLAERFRAISEHVIPPDASYVWRLEARRFFMVGAASVYDVLLDECADSPERDHVSPELVKALMDQMSDELERFKQDFDEGLV